MFKKYLRFKIIFFLLYVSLSAQTQSASEQGLIINDIGAKWSVGAHIYGGIGFDQHLVGKTTDNEDIEISGGGGLGILAILAYNFNFQWETSISGGYQNSSLSKNVKNADGDFSRTFFRASIKYRIDLGDNDYIKIGGGYGSYMPGELDIDASKVPGGAHNIFKYDGNSGPHISAEYEYIAANYTMGGGLRYVNITYDLTSAKSDGVNIPLSILPPEIKNEYMEFEGSGLDIFFSISYLFM